MSFVVLPSLPPLRTTPAQAPVPLWRLASVTQDLSWKMTYVSRSPNVPAFTMATVTTATRPSGLRDALSAVSVTPTPTRPTASQLPVALRSTVDSM